MRLSILDNNRIRYNAFDKTNPEMELRYRIIDANYFMRAAERCFEPIMIEEIILQWLPIPGTVLLALSIELYIKSLLFAENKRLLKTHNLKKLFEMLDPATQGSLIRGTTYMKNDFNTQLELHANVFADWRYLYESSTFDGDIEFIMQLAEILESFSNTLI